MKIVLIIIAVLFVAVACAGKGLREVASIGAIATLIALVGMIAVDGRSARHLVYAAAWALVVVGPFLLGFIFKQPVYGMAIIFTGWLIFPCVVHLLCAFSIWAETKAATRAGAGRR
jgi:hypothetical protein